MDEDTTNDLKQFITATVSQQLASHTTEIKEDIKKLDVKLSRKIDDLSESVAEAISVSNEEVDKQLKGYETRIINLESKTV